jgi:hypothetical protein
MGDLTRQGQDRTFGPSDFRLSKKSDKEFDYQFNAFLDDGKPIAFGSGTCKK